jgi:hypothetical protein
LVEEGRGVEQAAAVDEPVPDQINMDAARPEMLQDQSGRRSVVLEGRLLPADLPFDPMLHKGRLRTGHAHAVSFPGNDDLRLLARCGLENLVTDGRTPTV